MSGLGGREGAVFAGATAVGVVHALDDAFLHGHPGVGAGHFALPALLVGTGAAAGVAGFARLRPGLRAALAFAFGLLATVNGGLHVRHVLSDGVGRGDVTGMLAAAAGVVLLVLAAAIPWRHRGEAARSRGRRWAVRVVAVPAALVALVVVAGPMALAVVDTHKFRGAVGAPPDASYREVAFTARDGVRLSGWYRPTRNGATMLVLAGGSGERTGARRHAELLASRGYGVLLYDARGGGRSEGAPNTYGWGWQKDVTAALSFLRSRPEVEQDRIGALGLSTGADVLIDVAADRDDIAALVTDGAAAGSFGDWQRVRGTDLGSPSGWVMFATIRVLAGGDGPGPVLADRVARLRAPLLLVSAPEEREFNDVYERAAGGPVEHWRLRGTHHTQALRERRAEYERRVVGFLDRALSVRR